MESFFAKLVFWHWFALALVLGILDVALGANFLFVWCGLSATLVGVLLLIIPNMIWQYQLLLFGFGIMASLVVWQRYLKKTKHASDSPNLNRRAQQYVGRIFTLEEPLVNGRGKVRVDDSIWRIEGEDLPKGSTVKVIGVDGVILKVERI